MSSPGMCLYIEAMHSFRHSEQVFFLSYSGNNRGGALSKIKPNQIGLCSSGETWPVRCSLAFYQGCGHALGGNARGVAIRDLCSNILDHALHIFKVLSPLCGFWVHASICHSNFGFSKLTRRWMSVPCDTAGKGHPLCLLPMAVRKE